MNHQYIARTLFLDVSFRLKEGYRQIEYNIFLLPRLAMKSTSNCFLMPLLLILNVYYICEQHLVNVRLFLFRIISISEFNLNTL